MQAQAKDSKTNVLPNVSLTKKQKRKVTRKAKRNLKKATGKAVADMKKPQDSVQKGDARTARNTSAVVDQSNQQPAVTLDVPISEGALYGVVQQYVSFALSRGYLAFAGNPDFPYHAAVYCVNVLLSYIRNTPPQTTSLPYWLQCFGQALAPKVVKLELGYVQYRFTASAIANPFVPAANYPTGATAYAYEWLLYVPGSGDVDLFPIAAALGAYSAANGIAAWTSLAQFMTINSQVRMSQIVPLTDTGWKNNVSAYAIPQLSEGQGAGGIGGMVSQAGLEVPIFSPILSTFTPADGGGDGASRYRFPRFASTWAGDSMLSGAAFAQLFPPKFLHMKRAPKVHYIDFLELGNVLAIYASKLLEAKFNDTGAQTQISDPAAFQCPLTLQEMLLVLRNEVMAMFNRSQCAMQANYPRIPATGLANEFVPYLCSSNTVSLGTTGMRLPMPFVENIKSLLMRIVLFHQKDPLAFLPVIGQYATDELASSDYTATLSGDTPVTIDVFATLAQHFKRMRRDSKSNIVWAPEVEATISFIDGTSGANYVFINDTTRLQALTELWNNWIAPLSTYSSPLTVLSSDIGVNICCSISATRHWVPESAAYTDRVKPIVDDRITKTVGLGAAPYSIRQAIAISTHEKILSAPFANILNMWILPQNRSATAGINKTFFSRVQIIEGEPYSVSSSNVDTGVTMSAIHTRFASAMIRGPTSPLSELDSFFTEQAKLGHGGILSGLVADFVGKTFGPAVGGIAKSVANIIPI